MKFRLITGENGKWGKTHVVYRGEAENAIEFAKECACRFGRIFIIANCWIDAGNGTIPIDVANLKFD